MYTEVIENRIQRNSEFSVTSGGYFYYLRKVGIFYYLRKEERLCQYILEMAAFV